jgi:hypothetical protein
MFSDTHPDVEKIHVMISRSMPSWRRFRLVNDLIVTGRKLALAGLRERFHGASHRELHRRLATLLLGPELANKSMVPNPTLPPSDNAMEPLQILQRVISNLEVLGVHYMLVGSFASSLHGLARFTQDADLIVDLHSSQLDAFAQAFASDFYVDLGLIQQALTQGTSFNIIHFESSFKVDFFVVGGRTFSREEFSRRILRQVDPRSEFGAYVQTPEDAVLSKLDWYRQGGEISENQWRDVLGMLGQQAGRLDLVYLRKWAGELGVADLLQRACREADIEC